MAKRKKEQTDLFGNSIEEPAPDPTAYISPKLEKNRGYIDSFTVEELHQIRKCLGFDFKKGKKDELVSATLGFLSFLENEEQFKEWFELLPPYLSRAIQEAAFKGYIDAEQVERMTGKAVTTSKRSYYYEFQPKNPDLRLGLFNLYRNYGRKLLFMNPFFRMFMASFLPSPPHYSIHPCAEQDLSGWSAVETLSESMPLLFKSIDRLLEDTSRYEKILRRGLIKRDVKELRKSSAFPSFPLGSTTGIDPIELITRFLMIDPEQLKRYKTTDVRDFIKTLVTSFFTIPKSRRIVSNYSTVDLSFEYSVLCSHVSKERGSRMTGSLFSPHPRARPLFYQILTLMAKSGGWFNVDEVAEGIRMQDLPFSILKYDYDASELIVKGEELHLSEGTIKIDSWEKGFVPDIYLHHPLITTPLLKGYCYLMASLGLLEIEEEEPQKLLKAGGKFFPISPFEGLRRVRTTPFCAWCLGLSKEKPELREVSYEAIADRELPLVTYRGHSLECKVFLERIGDPIGEDRFRISAASFIRDCTSPEDIEDRIVEFYRLIAKEPAGHWGELFSRVRERAQLFAHEEPCMMVQLPEDGELRRLFVEEKKLSALVVRAEGGRIVVKQHNYKKLRKALEAYGVLYSS
ncbi:MAG: hypothetical protein K9L57_12025 [Spirochaetaceae bacterium]|nr:hypothetical protein [Spirochaetaceae bacterium]